MKRLALALAVLSCLLAAAPAAAQSPLRAGAGKADITPRLGYYLGGWTRADRLAQGQHTRLYARAIVLERKPRKVALVAIDLFMTPAGMVKHIGERLAARGFSEQNILISASHTHSGPGGYANFPTLNSAAPSMQTIGDPNSFFGFFNPQPAEPQLYRFLVEQIATAIERADRDLGPAVAGWGDEQIFGLTRNRSIEAHLANHGLELERGQGKESDDPGGYEHTIDPGVTVLRVDKVVKRRRVPIGGWSNFADHGTVTKSSFQYYNADHHGSALRVFEQKVRRAGRVRARQEVVNVYGNSNEGDMSAGLDRHGPAASDYVGRVEASAMVRAWRAAGRRMSRRPELDLRWTRGCMCGQDTEGGGTVASQSEVGQPFLTGSEEERGPLYDMTGDDYEGDRAPADRGDPHGWKTSGPLGDVPPVFPLLAIRVGDRVIVSIPGEGTKEMGARVRAAVASALAGSPIKGVVISGLANEFMLYFTTPEEYSRQHYEGGNTHFGTWSSLVVQEELVKLAGRLARGEPAQEAIEFDSTNGVKPDGEPYSEGAERGSLLEQPGDSYERLQHATVAWQGGPQGLDRPVDRAFLIAERRAGRRWVRAADDLGLAMLWQVDPNGRHDAKWEIPIDQRPGTYRFVIAAKRYRLVSNSFRVTPTDDLALAVAPATNETDLGVSLRYPEARRDVDLTSRPRAAGGGAVVFTVGGRKVRVTQKRATVFAVRAPAGQRVTVAGGAARDRYGNTAREGISLRP